MTPDLSPKQLAREIERANRAYANGMPYLTDSEYDILWKKLWQINPSHSALYHTTRSMDVGEGKLKHLRPIYGLQKAMDISDLKVFYQRHKDKSWIIQPKYDGVAATVYHNPDGLKLVLSGDGFIGSDISHHLTAINFVESELFTSFKPVENCELLIRWNNWNPEFGANPRNVVAGMINSHQIDKLGLIEAIPHDSRNLLEIKHPADMNLAELEETFLKLYYEASKIFPMDGLVIKLASEKDRLASAHNGTYYNWAIAWKPPIQTAETTVVDIEWNVSRNGRIIPTVVYEPIELCGTTNQRVTGNNARWLAEKQIEIGSKITVGKAGEIIPKILSANTDKYECELPFICPYCTSILKWEGVHLVCTSDNCLPQVVKRIAYFYSDKGMDLKGIGEAMIEELLTKGVNAKEILTAHPYALLAPADYMILHDMITIWGPTRVDNFYSELEKIRERKNIAHFVAGLGYKNLAYKTCYSIARQILGVETKENHSDEKVSLFMKGLKICQDFKQNADFKFMAIPANAQIQYCITGNLSQHRSEIIEYLSAKDWHFVNNVSKNTKYLILGDLQKESTKLHKAIQLGIKIISEDELYQLLNTGVD